MQRRSTVHTRCGRIKPETKHEVGRVKALVEDRLREVTVNLSSQRREEGRLFSEHSVRPVLVRREGGVDESNLRGTPGHEQRMDIAMTVPARDVVRRHAEAERPTVDVHGGNRRILEHHDVQRALQEIDLGVSRNFCALGPLQSSSG
jgi:hypothetical protein